MLKLGRVSEETKTPKLSNPIVESADRPVYPF